MANIDTSTSCAKRVNQESCDAWLVGMFDLLTWPYPELSCFRSEEDLSTSHSFGFVGGCVGCSCSLLGVWPKLLHESSTVLRIWSSGRECRGITRSSCRLLRPRRIILLRRRLRRGVRLSRSF